MPIVRKPRKRLRDGRNIYENCATLHEAKPDQHFQMYNGQKKVKSTSDWNKSINPNNLSFSESLLLPKHGGTDSTKINHPGHMY